MNVKTGDDVIMNRARSERLRKNMLKSGYSHYEKEEVYYIGFKL